ncbi:MAG: hypothetical protein ACHQF0_11980 [Chitinophagales bacterium]
MSKQIRSYSELLNEKQRLELLLQTQKQIIYYDIQQIKEELQPVRNTFEFIKKITTRDRTSLLLGLGSDIFISSFVKKFILSKAGWVIKTVIPFFLKNYSSHFIAEQKDKWLEKLTNWISGHKNGKELKKENSHADER